MRALVSPQRHLSATPRRLAVIARHLAAIARGLSAIARGLSAIARGLSAIARGLSAIARGLSAIARRPAAIARCLAAIARRLAVIARRLAVIARRLAVIARRLVAVAGKRREFLPVRCRFSYHLEPLPEPQSVGEGVAATKAWARPAAHDYARPIGVWKGTPSYVPWLENDRISDDSSGGGSRLRPLERANLGEKESAAASLTCGGVWKPNHTRDQAEN